MSIFHFRNVLVASASVVVLSTAAHAAATPADQSKIEALQQQVDDLSTQISDLKRSTSDQYADVARAEAAAPKSDVTVSLKNGRPTFTSADGRFTASIRALGQFDWGGFSQPSKAASFPVAYGPKLSDGSNFRRAYLGVQGKVFGDWSYNVNLDFGGNTGTEIQGRVQSLYIQYDGLGPFAFRIGAYPPAASLEDSTSAGDTIFLERNAPAEAQRSIAGGDGRDAASILYTGDNLFGSLSYTGGKVADGIGSYDEQTAGLGRISYLFDEGAFKFLIGANGTYVFSPAKGSASPGAKQNFSISAPPELTFDSSGYFTQSAANSVATTTSDLKLVNTGNINASHVEQWGVEGVAEFGSLYTQAGYFDYKIDRRASVLSDPNFTGWYAQASWVLTGETRDYNKANGAFSAPKPDAPLGENGSWGAWELAARYSDLDLNYHEGEVGHKTPSDGVRGGNQKILTLGLNWYPNSVIRFDFDYEHIDISRIVGGATAVAGSGTPPATFTVYPQVTAAQANSSANQGINAYAIRAQISL